MDIDMGALRELINERGIDFESAIQAVEEAILVAYQKTPDAYPHARADFDRKTGHVVILARKPITENPLIDDDLELSDEFEVELSNFSRIAASAAKTTLLAKIRQAEDFQVLGEFKNKKDQIVSGVIKQPEMIEGRDGVVRPAGPHGMILIDVGDGVTVQLPLHEQVPGEDYTPGKRIRVYVTDVSRGPKGPQITSSRSHPNLVLRLFELEVPELATRSVRIESIAREAGFRTKISIRALEEGVNAKGAFIGPMGQRARAVMNELGGEKIDIIDWDENPAKYIANALSPAKTIGVKILDESARSAHVVVPGYQLSLAIGREGQNARLAARLTGWKIDVGGDGNNEPVAAQDAAQAE